MVKQASSGKVTLLAGADAGPVVKPVEKFAERIILVLWEADIRLAQCEPTYSKRGWSPPVCHGPGGQHSRLAPEMASIFESRGIDIASVDL